MRLYLEAVEILPRASTLEPEFIRVDVTGMTEAEQSSVQLEIESVMAGKSYCLNRHFCYHGTDYPCVSELIKEVRI